MSDRIYKNCFSAIEIVDVLFFLPSMICDLIWYGTAFDTKKWGDCDDIYVCESSIRGDTNEIVRLSPKPQNGIESFASLSLA